MYRKLKNRMKFVLFIINNDVQLQSRKYWQPISKFNRNNGFNNFFISFTTLLNHFRSLNCGRTFIRQDMTTHL